MANRQQWCCVFGTLCAPAGRHPVGGMGGRAIRPVQTCNAPKAQFRHAMHPPAACLQGCSTPTWPTKLSAASPASPPTMRQPVAGAANSPDGFEPTGSLIKAVMLSGAASITGFEADTGLPLDPPPSFRQGFGRVWLGEPPTAAAAAHIRPPRRQGCLHAACTAGLMQCNEHVLLRTAAWGSSIHPACIATSALQATLCTWPTHRAAPSCK